MQENKRYGKLNLNIDPALHEAFRQYVFDSFGTTYKSGQVIEEILREGLEKRGVTIPTHMGQ